jgi:hypothetical protein
MWNSKIPKYFGVEHHFIGAEYEYFGNQPDTRDTVVRKITREASLRDFTHSKDDAKKTSEEELSPSSILKSDWCWELLCKKGNARHQKLARGEFRCTPRRSTTKNCHIHCQTVHFLGLSSLTKGFCLRHNESSCSVDH